MNVGKLERSFEMLQAHSIAPSRSKLRLTLAWVLLCVSGCAEFDEPPQVRSTDSDGSSSQTGDGTTIALPEPSSTTSTTSTAEESSPSTDAPLEPDSTSTTGDPVSCGNGVIEGDEACDDANRDSTDGCLSDCSIPTRCMDILAHAAAAASGIHEIDSDGPGGYGPYDAYCDMEHAGGGWTLVIVSADDGHATWTWQTHALMTTDTFLMGNVAVRDEDYKSAALHLVAFSDLLFVHEPSGVWASYDAVGDGAQDVGTFMSTLPFPQCDLEAGYPMTDGELTQIGTNLCSTDLYFHAGDYDGSPANQAYCEAFIGDSTATYGPGWSAVGNGGCPLDDPDTNSLGPSALGNYDLYPPEGIEDVEWDGRGFAKGMGLMQPDDRLEMYVR